MAKFTVYTRHRVRVRRRGEYNNSEEVLVLSGDGQFCIRRLLGLAWGPVCLGSGPSQCALT